MSRNIDEGPVTATGNDLDLAISGPGYFSIESPEGLRYSRHGRLQLDGQGQLVNSQGSPPYYPMAGRRSPFPLDRARSRLRLTVRFPVTAVQSAESVFLNSKIRARLSGMRMVFTTPAFR